MCGEGGVQASTLMQGWMMVIGRAVNITPSCSRTVNQGKALKGSPDSAVQAPHVNIAAQPKDINMALW